MLASIKSILKETNNDFTFSGAYTDLDGAVHNYTLYNNATFRQILLQMFGQRTYSDWDDETDLEDLTDDFISSYRVWMASRIDMYMARLYALDQKFNPLENYRSHEEREGSFEHGHTETLSFDGRKETTTDDSFVEHSNINYKETTKDDSFVEHSWSNNYTETYGHGQQTHTQNMSADDATNFIAKSQDIDSAYDDTKGIEGTTKDQNGFTTNGLTKEISGSTKDQNGYTDGLIREQSGTETRANSGTDLDGYTLERYGNIGVTTSQQMLASDIDLLKYDIVMIAIREFIGGYTYISCEVD